MSLPHSTMSPSLLILLFFFFNDTATTEIYTLSLHDALPISGTSGQLTPDCDTPPPLRLLGRSEEHTSELQSRLHLVCRLLLEKKNKEKNSDIMKHNPKVRNGTTDETTAA